MILECPSCQARFLVADALVPPAGRTVRCGACKHEWFVQPEPPEEAVPPPAAPAAEVQPVAAPAAVPVVETPKAEAPVDFATLAENEMPPAPRLEGDAARKLPVVKKRKLPVLPFALGASLLMASWFILAFIAYFPGWHRTSMLKGLYAAVGTTNTSGLVFEELSMEQSKEGARTKFLIAGSVANHGAALLALPKVRVELKDAEGEVVWSRKYPVNQKIGPGEVYPFRIDDVQTSFGDKVATVTVDLGNSLELAVR